MNKKLVYEQKLVGYFNQKIYKMGLVSNNNRNFHVHFVFIIRGEYLIQMKQFLES